MILVLRQRPSVTSDIALFCYNPHLPNTGDTLKKMSVLFLEYGIHSSTENYGQFQQNTLYCNSFKQPARIKRFWEEAFRIVHTRSYRSVILILLAVQHLTVCRRNSVIIGSIISRAWRRRRSNLTNEQMVPHTFPWCVWRSWHERTKQERRTTA